MNIRYNEDKENNIFSIRWSDEKTDICEEFTMSDGTEFVIDLNKKKEIIGIEVFNFNKGEFKEDE